MDSVPVIENFINFLEENLNGEKVLSYETKFLTKPGENYGSTILSVKVLLDKSSGNHQNPHADENGNNNELHLVAKMPPINESLWKMFQPEKTFIIEKSIYVELIPALRQLQKEANVPEENLFDVLPRCYAGRLSVDPDSNSVDKNACLLLENLSVLGYKVGDRHKGFNKEETLVILRDLAKFHALPIALRELEPKTFETKCLNSIPLFYIGNNVDQNLSAGLLKEISQVLRTFPGVTESVVERYKELLDTYEKYMRNPTKDCNRLFLTIAHNDLWVNNLLLLYDEKEKPSKCKIIDFQLMQYDSLIHDVIFFLFTSVQSDILNDNYTEFLRYYYNNFIKFLTEVGVKGDDYSEEKFMDEIRKLGPFQVSHIFIMLKVLFMEKEAAPDNFKDMKNDLLLNENAYGDVYYKKFQDVALLLIKFGLL